MASRGSILILALAVGCAGAVARKLEPLEGYSKSSPDAPPFEEISKTCREQAAFHSSSGTAWTDWEQFEDCMNQHGWTRAAEGASDDADASGGS